MDTWSNAQALMGDDHWWWFLPTQPTYKFSYTERVFSKKDIVSMYRLNEFKEEPPIESNEEFEFRLSQANREKWFVILCFLTAFVTLMLV